MLLSTSTTVTLREPMSRIRSTRPGTSKTSWTHSRTASSTIGKVGYWLATSSSCEARWRCCHSGWRRSGRRRGSSRARAAHSRNRAANSAEPPISLGDEAAHVVGVEGDQVEQLTADPALAHAVEVVELDVGQAQHDAVVAVHRLHVDAEPVAHPGAHGQRPRGVHLRAERGEDGDPPVAELVAEPLDDDRAVVGHVAGGLALLAQVAEQVVGGPVVEPGGHHPLARGIAA